MMFAIVSYSPQTKRIPLAIHFSMWKMKSMRWVKSHCST